MRQLRMLLEPMEWKLEYFSSCTPIGMSLNAAHSLFVQDIAGVRIIYGAPRTMEGLLV